MLWPSLTGRSHGARRRRVVHGRSYRDGCPPQTAKIGVGRDAADVSFMTVFTYTMFGPHEVSVNPVG